MRTFTETDDLVSHFTAHLESALLAQALAETGGLPDERARALLRLWMAGIFNATAAGLEGIERGALNWEPDGTGHRLVWYMSSGIVCPLARIYPQANGTWVSLVVAGVRDELIEAMAIAEWSVSRLATT